jgi:hypothetical protein
MKLRLTRRLVAVSAVVMRAVAIAAPHSPHT